MEQDSESLPPELIATLANFHQALNKFEEAAKAFIVPYSEHIKRDPLSKARRDLTTLFTINSLYWMYLCTNGKNPKSDDELTNEINRTKKYMAQLKQFDDRKSRPALNKRAAKAFVRNAMFELHAKNETEKVLDEANKEWLDSEDLPSAVQD